MISSPIHSPSVSKINLTIGGLAVDVYGIRELPPNATRVSCLWLHHPRLRAKEDMKEIASMIISDWSSQCSQSRGLIAVAFDQRNHGTRLIDSVANEAWRSGNKTHAQDMFGMVTGMVVDTSHLIDCLEGYLCGKQIGTGRGEWAIDQHVALGVSLGGHSVWQLMFAEPRVTAGVIVIGCPDYVALLSDRARLSKLSTFSAVDNGASFLGTKDFPNALINACKKYDPKVMLFGTDEIPFPTSEEEKERLEPLLDARIRGKKFLVLSGGADKLVPYAKSEPFLDFLKTTAKTWYKKGGISVDDVVYPGIGHEFNFDMMKDATRFINGVVSEADNKKVASLKL